MRNKNLYPVLCAVIVMLVATLACSSGTPGASNFFMATDTEGTNRTNTFSSTDDFIVFFDLNAIEPGTAFQARWYGLDIAGVDPNIPFETMDWTYEEGVGKFYFQLQGSEPWPAGSYKVEIYMNGVSVGQQGFSVQ